MMQRLIIRQAIPSEVKEDVLSQQNIAELRIRMREVSFDDSHAPFEVGKPPAIPGNGDDVDSVLRQRAKNRTAYEAARSGYGKGWAD
jgi:hypothetical protein